MMMVLSKEREKKLLLRGVFAFPSFVALSLSSCLRELTLSLSQLWSEKKRSEALKKLLKTTALFVDQTPVFSSSSSFFQSRFFYLHRGQAVRQVRISPLEHLLLGDLLVV